MINVNDIYEEYDGKSLLRVYKATREELESTYGKEMVKDVLDEKKENYDRKREKDFKDNK